MQILSIRTISIAALLVLAATASQADDAADFKLICGRWTNGKDFTITYNSDGTFASTFIPKGGKWRMSKGSLIQENPSAFGDGKTVVIVSSYRVTNQQLIFTRVVNNKQYRNEYKRLPALPGF